MSDHGVLDICFAWARPGWLKILHLRLALYARLSVVAECVRLNTMCRYHILEPDRRNSPRMDPHTINLTSTLPEYSLHTGGM